jgi:hypothetical protein
VDLTRILRVSVLEYRVQALRDKWCKDNIDVAFNTSTYARFVRSQNKDYMWRCITPLAMLDENMCYDISKNSEAYYTREELLSLN